MAQVYDLVFQSDSSEFAPDIRYDSADTVFYHHSASADFAEQAVPQHVLKPLPSPTAKGSRGFKLLSVDIDNAIADKGAGIDMGDSDLVGLSSHEGHSDQPSPPPSPPPVPRRAPFQVWR
eukprot:TRINITY_DN1939_c0_g2_i2.p4 TRINITY_DN1939_c0_g2~~TRINITY_DN1939_c0_g2_i2.p4  ORF type:complete len:120 (+),score=42.70 TRINITY_DN1939_c0_g2_i2:100-459(+)